MFDDGDKASNFYHKKFENGAITQEIDIIDTHFKVIYRLDVVSELRLMKKWLDGNS